MGVEGCAANERTGTPEWKDTGRDARGTWLHDVGSIGAKPTGMDSAPERGDASLYAEGRVTTMRVESRLTIYG